MLPGIETRRDDWRAGIVRGLAVLCGVAVLSIVTARIFQKPPVMIVSATPAKPDWIELDKPFPAFALSIPEAADAPFSYVTRRHATGHGRLDILTLGTLSLAAPALRIEVYRPGTESFRFGEAASEVLARAGDLAPVELTAFSEPAESKFGPISIATFRTGKGTGHSCIGFARNNYDPMLQIFGWFCQAGSDFIDRNTLACALDRFTLLSAGSEPKIGALFAQAELRRSFCGQRNVLMAPTPKHKALWTTLAQRAEAAARGRPAPLGHDRTDAAGATR